MSSFRHSSAQWTSQGDEGPWSDWIWNEQSRQYYRQRLVRGEWQTQWQYEYDQEIARASQIPSHQPRSAEDELTEQIARVNLRPRQSYDSQGSHERGYSLDATRSYAAATERSGSSHHHALYPNASQQTTFTESSTEYGPHATDQGGPEYLYPAGASGYDDRESVEQANSNDQPAYRDANQESQQLGNIQRPIQLRTHNDGLDHEPLDASYARVQKKSIKSFFREGRVFAVLWVEPSGIEPNGEDGFSRIQYGEHAFAEIRRFIIVKNQGDFHSICVPIMSYSGRGVVRRADATHHAIAYTSKNPPLPVEGENIDRTPIKIEPRGGNVLTSMSRINFSKVYTIEHKLKVKNIGSVPAEYMAWVTYYYRLSNYGSQPDMRPTA